MARNNGSPDLSKYKHEPRTSMRRDVTRFLMYAREHAPGAFISYPEVVQRISGYPRPPRIDSHEVKAVRSVVSAVRKALMEEHGCGLVTHPLAGIRATKDAADLAATQLVKAGIRLGSAQAMFVLTHGLVDQKEIPSTTPELRTLKTWVRTSATAVVKAIVTTDFAAKLLPPKKEEDKG